MFAKEGLEGIVAARTSISLIKGAQGALEYRGYSIHDLADNASFEEAAYLLWFGQLPTAVELGEFNRQLRSSRALPRRVIRALAGPLRGLSPIDSLRSAVSILAADDSDLADNSQAANLRKGVRLAAAIPAIVAAHLRLRKGLRPIAADRSLGHAENLLWMLRGRRPDPLQAHALDAAMVLLADHGLNASTFAARVAAGTLADLHSAVVAAIATLKGPLHGDAPAQVLDMLATIRDRHGAAAFVRAALAANLPIPGFGHRIYSGADPRVLHLRRWCERLATSSRSRKMLDTARAVERHTWRHKRLYPNVDFYAAPMWSMLGFPADAFAPLFACARIAGWVAHTIEQHLDNRLIRPEEEYIGPLSRTFIPIGQRAATAET